jgi:predicted ArsR family transcriptional regulator
MFTKEISSEETKILDCLKRHDELTANEIASFLDISRLALCKPLTYLMARGLIVDRRVEGIGKYPAIQTWGLKFYQTDKPS